MLLKGVLDDLLKSPAFAEGKVVVRVLPKGLTIKLKSKDGLVVVQLSRDGALPSKKEWKAVLECWPGQALVVEEPYELERQGNRRFLRGKLRVSPRLVE